MSEYLNKLWNNCTSWISNTTCSAIGNGLIAAGEHIEKIATIAIAIGILLWILKCTKVFRWGLISYFIGLLMQLIGLAII